MSQKLLRYVGFRDDIIIFASSILVMMNRILVLGFIFFAFTAQAQISRDILKSIDSLSQKKWDSTGISLDSLDNPKPVRIDKIFKDTVVLKNIVIVPQLPSEPPVTPYNFINDKNSVKNWFFFDENSLIFNQASFSNWNAGGNNNIGVIAKINYNLTYRKGRNYLENIILLGYGFNSAEGQSTRKTDDYINISTNYGYELGRSIYLSTGYQFLTQFTRGYNYSDTPDPTKFDRISQFMAPGYLNLGLGLSYNPSENLQIIFRPVNGKFTFVLDEYLQKEGKYGLLRDGQSIRTELGTRVNIVYRLKIYKDITLTNQLNLFSNYLSHFERVDIGYSGALNLKFNKYINATVNLDLLYDHDQIKKLQRKQTLGIGLSYSIGSENAIKENKKSIIKPFAN